MRLTSSRKLKAAAAGFGMAAMAAGAVAAGGAASAATKSYSPVVLKVSPASIKIAGVGDDVSFAFIGTHLAVDTTYTLNAPGLANACKGTLTAGSSTGAAPLAGDILTTDSNGRLNVSVNGTGCVAGNYTLELEETVAPFYDHDTSVAVTSAGSTGGAQRININPSGGATLTQNTGEASFAFLGRSLPAATSYTLSSPALAAACAGGDPTAGVIETADNNGNFDSSFTATGCVPGTYKVFATQTTSPYKSFSSTVTFMSPNSTNPY